VSSKRMIFTFPTRIPTLEVMNTSTSLSTFTLSLILLVVCSNIGLSQTKSDSLIALLKESDSDQEKVELVHQLSVYFNELDHEQVIKYGHLGIHSATPISDSSSIALFADELGETYRRLGEYDSSIFYLNYAAEIKSDLPLDSTLHTTYNSLGKVYTNQGNYELGVEHFILALTEMEKEDNLEGQAFYLNNIGIVFDIQGVYDKALEYYTKSLSIKKANGMTGAIAASYNNIAIVYFNLERFDKSLEFHHLALTENISLNDERKISRSYNNIGFAYISTKEYAKALSNLHQSLRIRKAHNDAREIAQTSINIATAYNELNQVDSAAYYVEIGELKALEIENNEILDDAFELKSDILAKQGKFEQALSYYQKHAELRDTLRNEDAFASIAEMEAKYNLVSKEKEIQKSAFQIEKSNLEIKEKDNLNKFYFALLIGSALSLILIALGYLQKRKISKLLKVQNALMSKQNRLLQTDKDELSTELEDKKELLENVFEKRQNTELPPELLALSKRELEVLSYLALGWSDNQISEKLFISKATVKTHLRRIYSKLLVSGRAGALAIAHQYNIIGGLD